MSNSTDLTQDSADQFVELDLLGREFRRSAPQAEMASLREFNSKLLERIGEFRNGTMNSRRVKMPSENR